MKKLILFILFLSSNVYAEVTSNSNKKINENTIRVNNTIKTFTDNRIHEIEQKHSIYYGKYLDDKNVSVKSKRFNMGKIGETLLVITYILKDISEDDRTIIRLYFDDNFIDISLPAGVSRLTPSDFKVIDNGIQFKYSHWGNNFSQYLYWNEKDSSFRIKMETPDKGQDYDEIAMVYPITADYLDLGYPDYSKEDIDKLISLLNNDIDLAKILITNMIIGLKKPSKVDSKNEIYTVPFEDMLEWYPRQYINGGKNRVSLPITKNSHPIYNDNPLYIYKDDSPLYKRMTEKLFVIRDLLDDELLASFIFSNQRIPFELEENVSRHIVKMVREKVSNEIGNAKKIRFISGSDAYPLTKHLLLRFDDKNQTIEFDNSTICNSERGIKSGMKGQLYGYETESKYWKSDFQSTKCIIKIDDRQFYKQLKTLDNDGLLYPVIDVVYKVDDVNPNKKAKKNTSVSAIGEITYDIDALSVILYQLPNRPTQNDAPYDVRLFDDPRNKVEKLLVYKLN